MKESLKLQMFKDYRRSLRGVRKIKAQLKNQLKKLGIEERESGPLPYKIELLSVIETTLRQVLLKHDARFDFLTVSNLMHCRCVKKKTLETH